MAQEKQWKLEKVQRQLEKKHYPNHDVYFSFQMGGDPRTIRETLIGPMFEGDNDADANMSADPEYIKLQEQLKEVAIEGTIEDEIRPIFS